MYIIHRNNITIVSYRYPIIWFGSESSLQNKYVKVKQLIPPGNT